MRPSSSSTDLLHSSICWVRPVPMVSVVPWDSCWLVPSDTPCELPLETPCELPFCSVVEWLVPLVTFSPNVPPMEFATLLKLVITGAMLPAAMPTAPRSGPTIGPHARDQRCHLATHLQDARCGTHYSRWDREIEVPVVFVTPPLMPPLMP